MPCIWQICLTGEPLIILPKGRGAGVSRQPSPKRFHPFFAFSLFFRIPDCRVWSLLMGAVFADAARCLS